MILNFAIMAISCKVVPVGFWDLRFFIFERRIHVRGGFVAKTLGGHPSGN